MKIRRAASFAQIIACIGIIPGFIGVFYTMEQQRIENEQVGKAMRLTALSAVNDMIEKDHDQQANIEKTVHYIEQFPEGHFDELPEGMTGRKLYNQIPGLSEAGRHYEHIGAMVKLGYIDFDLIFEVISFPRQILGQNGTRHEDDQAKLGRKRQTASRPVDQLSISPGEVPQAAGSQQGKGSSRRTNGEERNRRENSRQVVREFAIQLRKRNRWLLRRTQRISSQVSASRSPSST